MTALTPVVSVEELRRAYLALAAGEFTTSRRRARPTAAPGPLPAWHPAPGERLIMVLGALPAAGTSTVALALATVAGDSRVVECCTVAASGLAGASQAELGVTADGWAQGRRERVLIERRADRVQGAEEMPVPTSTAKPVTVLDCACEVDLLLAGRGWLAETARATNPVVVTTRPTLPGLRRLESAIHLLGVDRVHAVLGGATRHWTRTVTPLLGPAGRQLLTAGRLTAMPFDAALSLHGVTTNELPAPVLSAAATLLSRLEGPLS
ncbi:MAG: hypothetical protein J0I14_01195 [Propionibacteriaceae bacterium]|jgi:hypothetical protein|nr:hypothetical protein [Propionibacteriaceae bacterium]